MYGVPASVSSLDKDMRKLRMDRYTPQAAKEVRDWIEGTLGEHLAPGDLMEALKDGVALCKLANMALPPPGIKYKPSAMPFVQMENISHFLRACQSPPLNLQPHDVFLTVDLYEQKDPAQVIQCIGAFSRAANRAEPSRFPSAIGPGLRSGVVSPQITGPGKVGGGSYGNRDRGLSSASNTSSAYNASSMAPGTLTPTRSGNNNSGRASPTKNGSTPLSPGGISSWSNKQEEGVTSPAWNIHLYGYMGGADQGKMGVAFGSRRQITSAGPHVLTLAEKEKKRREEEERQRIQMEEAEHRRRVEREAEEERARIEEEERWAEETRKVREQEMLKAAEEKRKWEEEEMRWKMEEERRLQEEKEAEERLEKERRRGRATSDARLKGQFLSQYQEEQSREDSGKSEQSRIQELERELELARERERQYERERQERVSLREHRQVEAHDLSNRMKEESRSKSRNRSRSRPRRNDDEEWRQDEREYLRREWAHQQDILPTKPPRPLPEPEDAPAKPPRPLAEKTPPKPPRPLPEQAAPVRLKPNNTGPSSRPLPDPAAYASPPTNTYSAPAPVLPSRTDRFLSNNPAPQQQQPKTTYASEIGAFDSTAERDAEDRRRAASQAKTKAGGWASKSLLEREMEMERQRQKEWEDAQIAKAGATIKAIQKDAMDGSSSSGRRGIVGPRPPPGR